MAQRFGGKYSQGGTTTPQQDAIREARAAKRAVDAAGARSTLLFVPAIILIATSLNEGAGILLMALVGGGVLTLAAWLLRDGLRAEAVYHGRSIARRPALPRKMMATLLTGIGVAIAAYTGPSGVTASLLYGVAAAALHVAAFGIDPLRDKRVEGIDTFQQDRVARVVDEAESYLAAMTDHIGALKDRKLDQRLAGFQAMARKMIQTVEEDPRDLTAARKYLGVYLMGARDATVKFAEVYGRAPDAVARADYEALLTDLETNFIARTETLVEGDREGMDIEIKVLRDRLQREGIKPE